MTMISLNTKLSANTQEEIELFYDAVCRKLKECQKENWSRHVSAGFSADCIQAIQLHSTDGISRKFTLGYGGASQTLRLSMLNLRELEFLKEWLERMPALEH